MDRIVPMAGLILERSALVTGFAAAAIAVGGFIARPQALLGDASEVRTQRSTRSTVGGGIFGLMLSLLITLLDALIG